MNLLEIRSLFCTLSGREDLASTLVDGAISIPYGTNAGADTYINTGVRQLDLWQEHEKTLRTYTYPLGAALKSFELPYCIGIEDIQLVGSSGNTSIAYQIYQMQVDPYNIGVTATTDETARTFQYASTGSAYDRLEIELDTAFEAAQVLKIKGYFFTPYLTDNSHINFWSDQYPLTLVHAALYKLEGSYRNIEGSKAWKIQIDEVLEGIDRNLARLEMGAGRLVMGNIR